MFLLLREILGVFYVALFQVRFPMVLLYLPLSGVSAISTFLSETEYLLFLMVVLNKVDLCSGRKGREFGEKYGKMSMFSHC